jgi:hypothetical protein
VGGYDLSAYPGEDTKLFIELNKLGKPTMAFSDKTAIWTSARRLSSTPVRKMTRQYMKNPRDFIDSMYRQNDAPINIRDRKTK